MGQPIEEKVELKAKASVSLDQEIEEELKKEDPELQKAKAAINENIVKGCRS